MQDVAEVTFLNLKVENESDQPREDLKQARTLAEEHQSHNDGIDELVVDQEVTFEHIAPIKLESELLSEFKLETSVKTEREDSTAAGASIQVNPTQ